MSDRVWQDKLLVIDKDGTLVQTRSGRTFVEQPDDQRLIPGVLDRLLEMSNNGWDITIASNQGGVGSGHKTLKDAVLEMRYCIGLLPPGLIAEAFFCPDMDGQSCWWMSGAIETSWAQEVFHHSQYDVSVGGERVMFFHPVQGTYRKRTDGQLGGGMIGLARRHDQSTVLFVGDREEDKQAAADAGVAFSFAQDWLAGFILASD